MFCAHKDQLCSFSNLSNFNLIMKKHETIQTKIYLQNNQIIFFQKFLEPSIGS